MVLTMTDRSEDRNDQDDRPLTSAEMIKRAKDSVDDEIDIEGLENIDLDIPVEDEFPEPIPKLETGRPKQAARPRRTISAYDTDVDPFDRDEKPASSRAIAVAVVAALVLVGIGLAVLFYLTNGS
jgi:hypothetical protein